MPPQQNVITSSNKDTYGKILRNYIDDNFSVSSGQTIWSSAISDVDQVSAAQELAEYLNGAQAFSSKFTNAYLKNLEYAIDVSVVEKASRVFRYNGTIKFEASSGGWLNPGGGLNSDTNPYVIQLGGLPSETATHATKIGDYYRVQIGSIPTTEFSTSSDQTSQPFVYIRTSTQYDVDNTRHAVYNGDSVVVAFVDDESTSGIDLSGGQVTLDVIRNDVSQMAGTIGEIDVTQQTSGKHVVSLSGTFITKVNDISTAVDDESSRAQDVELSLATLIDDESSRAQDVELSLATLIGDESSRAQDVEFSLATVIDDESSRAQDVELSLATLIGDESSRAQDVEFSLATLIEDETSRAQDVDFSLATLIEEETSRATLYDDSIQVIIYNSLTTAVKRIKIIEEFVKSVHATAEVPNTTLTSGDPRIGPYASGNMMNPWDWTQEIDDVGSYPIAYSTAQDWATNIDLPLTNYSVAQDWNFFGL